MDSDFLVRVSCMTYNHAPYIEDAMNGFCMQETSFPYVCTIIDDASTDGEQEIIRKYLQEHFNLQDKTIVRNEETDDYVLTFARHKTNINCYFVVFFLKYNHYRKKSKAPYIQEWANTKYIALCEGDDYWIDDNKLQRQVEYMEKHDGCTLCYSKANCFNQNQKQFIGKIGHEIKGYKDLLMGGNSIPTLTTMFRNSHFNDYCEGVKSTGWLMGDYPLWIFLSVNGELHYEAKETAVYRILDSSASHFKTYESHKRFEDSVYSIRCFYAEKYGVTKEERKYIENEYNKLLFNLAYEHKEYKTARDLFHKIKTKDIKIVVKYLLVFFHLF